MRLCFLLVMLALGAASCRSPHPKTAEEVRAASAPEGRPPSIFDKVAMSPKQRNRADAMVARLSEDFDQYNQVRDELFDEIIRQIGEGSVDRERLQPLVTESIRLYREAKPSLMRFANELHALLDEQQRRQLLSMTEEDEQDELTPAEEQKQDQEELLDQLDLTTGQKARLYPALLALALRYWGPISRYRGGVREAKEAFVEDDFRAEDLDVFQTLPLEELADAVLAMLSVTLKVINDEQEESLAAIVESMR